jgi:hypothetical protein
MLPAVLQAANMADTAKFREWLRTARTEHIDDT